MINREFIGDYADFPSVQCFDHGLEFLDGNRHADELRADYCATVALCAHELGRLLDYMDRHALRATPRCS